MEVLTHAGLQMLILFTVVLLGALARKLHLMNDAFDALLSKLVMTVALPGMILNSVLGNTNLPDSDTILMLLACSTVLYFFICLFAWVFVRVVYRGVPKPAQGAHAYLISFGNTGFIGFAVLGAIMGNDAVLYGAVYNIPYNVFMFSVGMLFIASTGTEGVAAKKPLKEQVKAIGKQLVSPCLISCFIAMFLALFGVTDSGYIGQTVGTDDGAGSHVGNRIDARQAALEADGERWLELPHFVHAFGRCAAAHLFHRRYLYP